jgi:hypothetical protein
VFLPETEPDRTVFAQAIAERLRVLASAPERGGLLLAEIDAAPAAQHALAAHLRDVGFLPSTQGFYLPRRARDPVLQLPASEHEQDYEQDDQAIENA